MKKLKKEIIRKLRKRNGSYSILEKIAQDLYFGMRKDGIYFKKLIDYMRAKQKEAGYKEINTPEILDKSLWEKSGHWEKFGEHMYTSTTPDEKVFAIKPMNCPGCV